MKRFFSYGFLITVVVALVSTVVLGRAKVELCLDLDVTVPPAVRAEWPEDGVDFEPILPAYEPHFYSATITALPVDEPRQDRGYQMISMAALDAISFSNEEDWSHVANYFLLHGTERPATLGLSGWNLGPGPYVSFETDGVSGVVAIESGGGPTAVLDLATEDRGKLRHALQTSRSRKRFYVRVPRHALDELVVRISGQEGAVPERLYVNTFVPHVLYRDTPPARTVPGFITEHWSPEEEIRPPDAFYLGANPFSTFIVVLLGLSVVLLSLGALVRLLRRPIQATRMEAWAQRPVLWKVFALCWAPIFCSWFFFLVVFYPGTMNADSFSQWSQTRSFHFEPQHPPFYAWCMWIMQHLWDSPFSTALPQVVIGSALLAAGAALLWHLGVKWYVVALVCFVAACSPRNATTMIALIKDAPYGICMLGMAVSTAALLIRSKSAQWPYWCSLGLAMAAATLFRHNGPMMVAGLLPFLALLFRRQWRGVALAVVVLVVVVATVRVSVLSRLPMEPTAGGLHDLYTSHLAILVDRDVPMDNESYEFLARVRDLDDRWSYDPRRVAATTVPFLEEVYHRAWAKEHAAEYRAHYIRLVTRNLLTSMVYFWDRGDFIVVPWRTKTPMETYFLGIPTNDLALSNFDVLLGWPDRFRSLLAWSDNGPLHVLFWRPALPLYLAGLACLVLCFRARDPRWLAVYLPFAINTAIVGLAAVSQASRYQFPLTFASAFLVALACLPLRPVTSSESGGMPRNKAPTVPTVTRRARSFTPAASAALPTLAEGIRRHPHRGK